MKRTPKRKADFLLDKQPVAILDEHLDLKKVQYLAGPNYGRIVWVFSHRLIPVKKEEH